MINHTAITKITPEFIGNNSPSPLPALYPLAKRRNKNGIQTRRTLERINPHPNKTLMFYMSLRKFR
ncbi:hypothetical protein ACUNIY_12750 [Serratia sp. IR-2025]|uniref:hypothetical protein n=1 Tax=Serratia marcescens TaxID=615 RepID=UPI003879407B